MTFYKNVIRKILDYRILGNALLSFLQKGRLLHDDVKTPNEIANINALAIELFKALNNFMLSNLYTIDKDYNAIKRTSKTVCDKKVTYFNLLNQEYISKFGGNISFLFPKKKNRKQAQDTPTQTIAERIKFLKAMIEQYTEEVKRLENEENANETE